MQDQVEMLNLTDIFEEGGIHGSCHGSMGRQPLPRIIHDGSSRNRAVVLRDGPAAVPVPLFRRGQGAKKKGASPQQHAEGTSGESARRRLVAAAIPRLQLRRHE